MPDDRYRFTVGNFECLIIKDTTSKGDIAHLFKNADESEVTSALLARNEDTQQADMSFNTLAVFSDDWVLIDTGFGGLGDTAGQTISILNDEDIRPEHIIITHAHPDHYGGLLDDDGNENFPNVPVYMCQKEWMFFISGDYADANPSPAETVQKYLLPAERQIERIECLNMNEILPGFSVVKLQGHTPNHIGVLIESAGERLIFASDALLHPLHLEHLDWQAAFDGDHHQARESRVKLAELAIELDALVMCYHFPFPGLGRIERTRMGYKWRPVEE